jgi:hypothetical protein
MDDDDDVESKIELIFQSGPLFGSAGPKVASAYIAMGSFASDKIGRPMITAEEMSFDALKAQVEFIKATLDARLGEAKARFAAAK